MDWYLSEKHYITEEELREFARNVWYEATGEKLNRVDIGVIENLVCEEFNRMYWRDRGVTV